MLIELIPITQITDYTDYLQIITDYITFFKNIKLKADHCVIMFYFTNV